MERNFYLVISSSTPSSFAFTHLHRRQWQCHPPTQHRNSKSHTHLLACNCLYMFCDPPVFFVFLTHSYQLYHIFPKLNLAHITHCIIAFVLWEITIWPPIIIYLHYLPIASRTSVTFVIYHISFHLVCSINLATFCEMSLLSSSINRLVATKSVGPSDNWVTISRESVG